MHRRVSAQSEFKTSEINDIVKTNGRFAVPTTNPDPITNPRIMSECVRGFV